MPASHRRTIIRRAGLLLCLLGLLLVTFIIAAPEPPMRPPQIAAPLAMIGLLAAGEPIDPLLRLPEPPKPVVAQIAAPPSAPELVPGSQVHCAPGADARHGLVMLPAEFVIDRGPVDGLEVLLCLDGGKTHESLAKTRTSNGALVKAACIAGLGLDGSGAGSPEASNLPARGWPVRTVAWWQADDGGWRSVDATCLVRDRINDKAYPPLPFVYTGSRMHEIRQRRPDGTEQVSQRFALDLIKSVIVNFDEPDALFASPFPRSNDDQRFEVNSAICPPAGTPVWFALTRTDLPGPLLLGADGALSFSGKILDDPALAELIGGWAKDTTLRAVAVTVAKTTPRTVDGVARERLLNAAATAKVWMVPIFVPVE
ncbi:hypothetical protein LBMAG53_22840 [Planctomycetota bacterium]|nr:hypothetical protein LBMAG53_22840 [Planctomycetota bacterium]